jgi:phage shock protein PspC (stress-responsive transcriptional regulator)
MEETDKIQAYIKKILALQQEQRQRPVDSEELKRTAQDLGLSDSDMDFIERRQKDYFTRGEGYSRYEDWDSAIEEYMQAIILNPSHVEALYGIANAYKERYLIKKNKDDWQEAKNYVKQALQLNPNHENSFKLSAELNKGTFSKTNPFSNKPTTNQPSKLDRMMAEILNNIDKPMKTPIYHSEKPTVSDLFKPNYGNSRRKLRKSNRDRKIFGVCGGVGEYLGIDSIWIRLAFILSLFVTGGATLVLYIALAILMPKY